MFKKSSPIVRAAVFALAAAIVTQLSLFPLARLSFAQEPAAQKPQDAAVPTTQVPATAGNEVVLADGTEFTVTTTEEISSKTATEGDPLSFKVTEDVKVNGHVVIAEGTLVKGVVASAKKSGMLGKGGNLGIRVESTMTVDNQKVKLRSSKGKEGDDKTGTTVALVVLFGPLGFLKHGKNAIIKSGTQIKVFTDEEKKIQPKS